MKVEVLVEEAAQEKDLQKLLEMIAALDQQSQDTGTSEGYANAQPFCRSLGSASAL